MNKSVNMQTILAVGFIGLATSLSAQETTSPDSVKEETVIIRREYEPVIKDAKKINHQPLLNSVEKTSPNFTYKMLPQDQEYEFTPDTIDAVKIKGEPLNSLYRAYLKAGMGSYLNNYGELHINSLRSRDFQWGLDVHHLGSVSYTHLTLPTIYSV